MKNCTECHHFHILDRNNNRALCMKKHYQFHLLDSIIANQSCTDYNDSFRFEDYITHILRPHYGHNIGFSYKGKNDDPSTINIMCYDCNVTIISDDKIDLERNKWYKEQEQKRKAKLEVLPGQIRLDDYLEEGIK